MRLLPFFNGISLIDVHRKSASFVTKEDYGIWDFRVRAPRDLMWHQFADKYLWAGLNICGGNLCSVVRFIFHQTKAYFKTREHL